MQGFLTALHSKMRYMPSWGFPHAYVLCCYCLRCRCCSQKLKDSNVRVQSSSDFKPCVKPETDCCHVKCMGRTRGISYCCRHLGCMMLTIRLVALGWTLQTMTHRRLHRQKRTQQWSVEIFSWKNALIVSPCPWVQQATVNLAVWFSIRMNAVFHGSLCLAIEVVRPFVWHRICMSCLMKART